MKINLKAGAERYTVEFTVIPSTDKMSESDFIVIPKSEKNLSAVYKYIAYSKNGWMGMALIVSDALGKKLKLPMEPDYGHTQGPGYGVKIDKYSLIKKLK
jgi:hypothetical protein